METQINQPSITEQCFRKERAARSASALRGAVMFLLGTACGVPALSGGKGLLSLFLSAAFFALSVTGLARLFYALYRLLPSKSVFGRLLLFQVSDGQSLASLRAEIDRDLAGRSPVGPVTVGDRWMIMDNRAWRLATVCGVFTIKAPGETCTLCLADVEGRIMQMTRMEPSQAAMAAEYLHRRLPEAATGDFDACQAFLNATPERRRQHQTFPKPDPENWNAGGQLAFWDTDDIPTSLFTLESVTRAFEGMTPDSSVGFTFTGPVRREQNAAGLFAERDSAGAYALVVPFTEDEQPAKAVRPVSAFQALEALRLLMETGALPDFSGWDRADWFAEKTPPLELHVDGRIFCHNTLADVSLTLDQMTAGGCQSFSLIRPGINRGALFVDRAPDGYRVRAAVPDGLSIRWMETVTGRADQLRFWVEGYYNNAAFPYFSGWKDITGKLHSKR